MLEIASGIKAFSVGKPSPVMVRGARKELGLDAERTVIIGDTMETDILGGVQLGYHTVLVLSGSTRAEDLGRYAYRPDLVVDSIADLNHLELAHRFRKPPRPEPDAARATSCRGADRNGKAEPLLDILV
jgi:NagD protein